MVPDNYAWFFNYNWFHKKWNWKDDGSHSFKKRLVERDDDPIADDDTGGAVPEANLDLSQDTVPINCHLEGTDEHGSPMATCDYVGEDYNDFLVDVKLPFKSAGNCDLSAECNLSDGYAVDPKCTCTCDGQVAALRDPRCAGFAGSLPDPPANSPPNGP
ncbi:hypothetical protein VTN96DRAFT_6203 [Rasamsonia emersonii]